MDVEEQSLRAVVLETPSWTFKITVYTSHLITYLKHLFSYLLRKKFNVWKMIIAKNKEER